MMRESRRNEVCRRFKTDSEDWKEGVERQIRNLAYIQQCQRNVAAIFTADSLGVREALWDSSDTEEKRHYFAVACLVGVVLKYGFIQDRQSLVVDCMTEDVQTCECAECEIPREEVCDDPIHFREEL
jgi:hypothetical protein